MTLETVFNRAVEFTGAYANVRAAPAQVEHLSIAALSATDATHRMEAFALWCYERDERGRLVHILPNGQIPSGRYTPWGASGKSRMTRTDRDVLRRWLCIERNARRFPPWFYHADQRRWYVDLMRYDELSEALTWLAKHPIQPRDWLNLSVCAGMQQ